MHTSSYPCKDNANRTQYKVNQHLLLLLRCSLSYLKIMQIECNSKFKCRAKNEGRKSCYCASMKKDKQNWEWLIGLIMTVNFAWGFVLLISDKYWGCMEIDYAGI